MVILGEVGGLTGNVRSIPRIERRINGKAKKLGFKSLLF